jgi:hypothetical protein
MYAYEMYTYEVAMGDSRPSEIHAYGMAYERWHAYEMVSVRGMPMRWLIGDARSMRQPIRDTRLRGRHAYEMTPVRRPPMRWPMVKRLKLSLCSNHTPGL